MENKMKLRVPKFSILKLFVLVIMIPTSMVFVTIATMHHDSREFKVTHEVFFDIESDGKSMGRMSFALFGETLPKTVANFIRLSTRGHEGKKYQGTRFHRVIKKFMIQGGDVVSNNGKGQFSIYGPTFPDENLDIKHSRPGFLSMANNGKDTNGCQFFITTLATPWLDGHHVVFGKLTEGLSVLHAIEYVATDWNDKPLKDIIIAKAGKKVLKKPYYISDDPYNLKDWLTTISIPLGLSFAIIYIFNHFIKKIDAGIIDDDGAFDDEEAYEKRKQKWKQEEEELMKLEEKKKEEEEKEETEGEGVRKRAVKVDE